MSELIVLSYLCHRYITVSGDGDLLFYKMRIYYVMHYFNLFESRSLATGTLYPWGQLGVAYNIVIGMAVEEPNHFSVRTTMVTIMRSLYQNGLTCCSGLLSAVNIIANECGYIKVH